MRLWVIVGVLVVLSCFLGLSGNAKNQEVSSLTTCEQFGNRQLKAWQVSGDGHLFLIPETSIEDKFEGKVGNQFVSTVLSGNGLIRSSTNEVREIQFTCLLEKQNKAVFFHTTVPEEMTPLSRCSVGVKTVGESVPCLQDLLSKEEARLTELETKAAEQGKRVDQQWTDVRAGQALVLSTADWKQYRDQECERRGKFRAGGNHPDITLFECQIQKTRQRIQDLTFNQ